MPRPHSLGLVSTYPPTACGLATFTAALGTALRVAGAETGVVRLTDQPLGTGGEVTAELVAGRPDSTRRALAQLGRHDVAVFQHEYGIYAGRDGEQAVELVGSCPVPRIVVAHTVLREPTAHQREVLEAVCERADAVVVMSAVAARRLARGYGVDPRRVEVIPHGARPSPASADAPAPARMLLTWGLLGPGKGIEWAIEALALLDRMEPRPRYVVAGRTHPHVVEAEGERYREGLVERARRLGVGHRVAFDARYHRAEALHDLIRRATVVVLPYDTTEQVTSGVLVDAIASGTPVVATAFPHAVEVLRDGAGLVVPHRDPVALADALRTLLTDDDALRHAVAAARRLAPTFSWSRVAEQYLDLAARVARGARATA